MKAVAPLRLRGDTGITGASACRATACRSSYGDTLRTQAQAMLKATVAAYQADRTDFLNLLTAKTQRWM